MSNSSLKLIFPAKTKLPITIGAFIHIVEETAIELLTKHFNTKLTRLLALFLCTLQEIVHLSESLPYQDEHFMLSEIHFANQTSIFSKDLLTLELEVAFSSNEETPESQLKRETNSLYMLDLNR
jgi:hypothetical protein